jgi:hypothetical protein
VGDKKEPCGTPACIHLGVDISPSAETLNFRCKRNELMSLIILVEKFNLDNLVNNESVGGRVMGGCSGKLNSA